MHALQVMSRHVRSTRRMFHRLAWVAGVALCSSATVHAASLDASVLPKIQSATFEVVAAKPVNDPLTYEKPLPLELLPFQERTDKYYSIGTAFAIGNNRFVTAAHVLQIGSKSLWGEPALRDASGHVYAIGKIEKFSLQQDFVVFSLAEQPATATALEVNLKPALNEVVFAVGNALGTGVVIRDGLYTSDTPEDQDGRWKWMRFSAAASPGNSGGPLLDKDGKLIGIVLMKSANENLNFALPISAVLNAPDHQATMDTRVAYQLDIFDTIENGTFKTQFALPLTFAAFYAEYNKRFDSFSDTQLKALLAKDPSSLFPNGAGSARLLSEQTRLDNFPTIIARGSNGEWGRTGSASQHFTLDANGYIDIGEVARNGLMHLRRPDSLDAAKFYGDAVTRMDLVLKTGLFQREVAGEKIKITSLGTPTLESVHTDRWQRPWQVDAWPLPYMNGWIVMYSLPVPDGTVAFTRLVSISQQYDTRLDMDEISNYIYATYEGTLAQWKDYLRMRTLLPDAFKSIHVDFDIGKRFSYTSKRVAFSYTSDVQSITPDNLLWLGFRFLKDGDQPIWDVGDVNIWKTTASDDHDNVNIQRFAVPPQGLDNDISSHWQKLSARAYPYNAVARYENDLMKIDAVIAPANAASQPPAVLYTAFYGVAGTQPQADMKRKLDLLTKDMQIREH
ncbi:trypsin-like peptidase domain-containing protein [Rhodanobacter sp. L36]|uniref:S1 family peptidase n=1 Tax=Rhodanobacter sp. L36 TaxID=1747221 RepID=UPI0020B10CE0|nr:trypsin-like peptidase domain-containing protein [Rhodanobacter sp. L36]